MTATAIETRLCQEPRQPQREPLADVRFDEAAPAGDEVW